MPCLTVQLEDRSYPIEVGSAILETTNIFAEHIRASSALVVTNSTVAPLYLKRVNDRLQHISKLDHLILPDGECYKNLEILNLIFDKLLADRHGRDTTLIALGGGVIGDMVGFAAASYQRGVDFIQVPTTLLSQVDSSVGGKTGVNHPMGKNMIGAFYQPKAVIIDTQVLSTLPDREFAAGMAEVIKYGMIYDRVFFDWLEEHMAEIMARNEHLLTKAILRCCAIKAEVVAADELENNSRAILNFGHTYGHAIEVAQGYGNWLHGEAVGAGMAMACQLSYDHGWLSQMELTRALRLIASANLPVAPPSGMRGEDFMRYMALDKKVSAGKLNLILLKGLGAAIVTANFEQHLLLSQLNQLNT